MIKDCLSGAVHNAPTISNHDDYKNDLDSNGRPS